MGDTIIGTQLKLNINIEAINGIHMSNLEFSCKFYVDIDNAVTINKDQMIYKDDDNYLAILDTTDIGIGRVRARVTAQIPDTDFSNKLRTEIIDVDTGIVVNK